MFGISYTSWLSYIHILCEAFPISIIYLQLPLFQKCYCPQCYALASSLEDQLLKELFGGHEMLKCTFCRFLLTEDTY